jgi:CheY-like chemotaxis protein
MPPSVLLVHAATDDRGMYAEYLRARDCTVVESSTTDDAFQLVGPADAIVTGLLMPTDGVEFIRQVKASYPGKPVIVVTACVVTEVRERAVAAGCDALFVKPCLPDLLWSELRRLLRIDPRSG